MRSDMGKVITEKPRHGSSWRSKKYRGSIAWKGSDEDYALPKRAKISKRGQYGWDAREFTDVLGPLKRYLAKQVGRPWNNVYSELCSVLDKRKLTHRHVLDHVAQWVNFRNEAPGPLGNFYWYVVDSQGIIRVGRPYRKYRSAPRVDPDLVAIDAAHRYQRISGIWYRVGFRVATPDEKRLGHQDVILTKRQLGKKELRQAGLSSASSQTLP